MNYEHPDARQRVLEEIERTVWPLDRKFFREHPNRNYRIRQPLSIEIVENELLEGRLAEHPSGTVFYIMVRQFAPGLRARLVFFAPPGAPEEPPEKLCRQLYRRLCRNNPHVKEFHQKLAEGAANLSTRVDLSRENHR